jgi:tRNA threonylcarbamoyladenosine biosynthesis protein TsaB
MPREGALDSVKCVGTVDRERQERASAHDRTATLTGYVIDFWRGRRRVANERMNLLALDTSTDVMSVAVCKGEREAVCNEPGGAHASSHLVPKALALLDELGLSVKDVDAVACARGPGAFTGLRTAVSVAQGMAFGAGKPVLPLDSLCVVAEDARGQGALGADGTEPGDVWVAMDARMDEVYAGAFQWDGQRWTEAVAPALMDLATLQDRLAVAALAAPGAVLRLCGNAVTVFADRIRWPEDALRWPQVHNRAEAALRLARMALRDGQGVSPEQALPVYLRDKVALTTAEREALKAAATPSP